MKYGTASRNFRTNRVAPLAGAWIEILYDEFSQELETVAPLAGAWIEIAIAMAILAMSAVAPLAGAWIEICSHSSIASTILCRSPRGSVD